MLKSMGFKVEQLPNGSLCISKRNMRYRTPIVKRNGSLQGNIEFKPANISWGDVNMIKNNNSKRFVGGQDTVANNHLTIEE